MPAIHPDRLTTLEKAFKINQAKHIYGTFAEIGAGQEKQVFEHPTDPAKALKTIREAIDNDYFHQNLDALAEARDLVLNKYQLFPHVADLIQKHGVQPGAARKSFYIPKNKVHGGPTGPAALVSKILKRIF